MYSKELKTYNFMQFVYFLELMILRQIKWWRSKVYKESRSVISQQVQLHFFTTNINECISVLNIKILFFLENFVHIIFKKSKRERHLLNGLVTSKVFSRIIEVSLKTVCHVRKRMIMHKAIVRKSESRESGSEGNNKDCTHGQGRSYKHARRCRCRGPTQFRGPALS